MSLCNVSVHVFYAFCTEVRCSRISCRRRHPICCFLSL